MKTLIAVLALVFFSAASALANETPVTYLIYRSSFTNGQINIVKAYGYSKNDQPVKITRIVQPPNTNYATITIATTTNMENTALQTLLSQGKIQPLTAVYLKSAYDGRIGGNVSWVEKEDCKSAPGKYVCLPQDFNRDWTEVKISSP